MYSFVIVNEFFFCLFETLRFACTFIQIEKKKDKKKERKNKKTKEINWLKNKKKMSSWLQCMFADG